MQSEVPKKREEATAAPARPETEKDEGQQHSKLYHVVMTPINFISFVLGLWLIDMRYQCQREHTRYSYRSSSSSSSWPSYLPAWLWGSDRQQQQQQPSDRVGREERFYYHTKQKKLLRMEASEAFGLRNRVIFGLVLVVMLGLLTTSWAIRSAVAWLVA